ncbi:hypothetical protein BKA56DRAFT_570892 [Ilyonectria sp. MPI-CAGE-AT-0026]|nr:hypothetical protein BKA56DRAFT_570892 [Ilyonectria sp. MPI-CAGE-AT-0026]
MLGEMTPVERGRSRLCLAPHPPTYQPSKSATSNHPPCSHATPLVGRCRTEIPVPIPMPRTASQLLGLDRSVYPFELVPGRRVLHIKSTPPTFWRIDCTGSTGATYRVSDKAQKLSRLTRMTRQSFWGRHASWVNQDVQMFTVCCGARRAA